MPDVIVLQVQDLRERRRAEDEREQRIREQAARAQAERTSERLRPSSASATRRSGTLAFDDARARAAQPHPRGAGRRHRRGRARRRATATVVVYQAAGERRPRRCAGARDDVAPSGRQPTVAIRSARVGGSVAVDAARRRWWSTAGRSARCTSARCSRARSPTRRGAAAARGRPRGDRHRSARGCTSASTGSPRSCSAACCRRAAAACPGFATAARYFAGRRRRPGRRRLVRRADRARRPAAAGRSATSPGAASTPRRRWASCAARCAPTRSTGTRPASLLERLNAFQVGLRDRGMTTVVAGRASTPRPARCATRRPGTRRRCSSTPRARRTGSTTRRAAARARRRPRLHGGHGAARARARRSCSTRDGLVELRGESLDRGFERLAAATIAAPDDDRRAVRRRSSPARSPTRPPRTTSRCSCCARAGARRRAGGGAVPAPAHRPARPPAARRHLAAPARCARPRVELPGGLQASARRPRRRRRHAGRASPPRGELDDLLIVVTELVNNAVVHGGAADAGERVLVHVAAADERLRVEVSSRGAAFELRAAVRRRGARRLRAAARRPALQPLGRRRRRRLLRLVRDRSFAHRRISDTARAERSRQRRRPRYGPPGSPTPRARAGA